MQHLMDASSKTCFDNRCLSTNADPSARQALGLLLLQMSTLFLPANPLVHTSPSCSDTLRPTPRCTIDKMRLLVGNVYNCTINMKLKVFSFVNILVS